MYKNITMQGDGQKNKRFWLINELLLHSRKEKIQKMERILTLADYRNKDTIGK